MNPRIQLELTASDKMTPALILAQRGIDQLGNRAAALNQYMQRLNQSTSGYQRVVQGLSGAANGVSQALGAMVPNTAIAGMLAAAGAAYKLVGALNEGGRVQTQSLATTSDIATNLGVEFGIARKEVELMNTKISQMAASLPGETKQYNEMFGAIGGSLAKMYKGNIAGFQEASQDITKRAGVLASVRGIGGAQAGSVIERLISGNGGFGELALNDVIQKNAIFKQALIDGMRAMGKDQKDWQNLSSEMRLSIVRKALKTATPDSLIDQFNGTFESVTQGIKSYWFDLQGGVFGVLRQVEGSKGSRSVLDAVAGALEQMTRAGNALMNLGSAKGLNFDPMLALITFFDSVTQVLNGVEYFIRSGGKLPKFNFDFDITKYLKNLSNIVPQYLNDAIHAIQSATKGTGVSNILGGLSQVTNGLMGIFSSVFAKVDWSAVGEIVGRIATQALIGAGRYVLTLNYAGMLGVIFNILVALGKLIGGALQGVILAGIDAVVGGLKAALGFAGALWQGLVDGVKSFIDKVTSWLSNIVLNNPVSQGVQAVSSFVADPIGTTGNFIKEKILGQPAAPTPSVGAGATAAPGQPIAPMTPGAPTPLKPANVNSRKVAYTTNTYSPSISVAQNESSGSLVASLGSILESQYNEFISGLV